MRPFPSEDWRGDSRAPFPCTDPCLGLSDTCLSWNLGAPVAGDAATFHAAGIHCDCRRCGLASASVSAKFHLNISHRKCTVSTPFLNAYSPVAFANPHCPSGESRPLPLPGLCLPSAWPVARGNTKGCTYPNYRLGALESVARHGRLKRPAWQGGAFSPPLHPPRSAGRRVLRDDHPNAANHRSAGWRRVVPPGIEDAPESGMARHNERIDRA
jgi:hypothetical protein